MKIAVFGIKNKWSSECLCEAFRKLGAECELMEIANLCCDLENRLYFCEGRNLEDYDAVVLKKLGAEYSPSIIDYLEMLCSLERKGTPFFSSPARVITMINRLSCTLRLREAGIPMPDTFITENMDEALEWMNQKGEVVLKPFYSTKARGMIIVSAGAKARQVLTEYRESGNRFFYMQKTVNIPGQDYGIVFLGGEYLGTYARVAQKGSWNTTTQDGGKYAPYDPSPEIIELAKKAQAPFGLEFTCVDLAMTPDGPIIFETSAFGGFRGLKESRGVDAAALYAEHILNKLKS